MNKHKHLSEDERRNIQYALDQKKSFKQIAREIGRDCTTVSKEIKGRRVFKQSGSFNNHFNDCAKRFECFENNLCNNTNCRKKLCRRCTYIRCSKRCGEYSKQKCLEREKPPYVCNACSQRNKCTLEKAIYSATSAQKEYTDILRESRSGICAEPNEIQRLDTLLSKRLINGQSIHHVCVNSSYSVMWSEKTIYKYVGLGILRAKNIDLPRKVRFRPRKSRHESLKVCKSCRMGRTYADYMKFVASNSDIRIVEMDTVHGVVGGKCLLTLHFVSAHFMLAYLLPACTAQAVRDVFARLRCILGNETFAVLFPVILTDNGSEFSDPMAIEIDDDWEVLSKVFYCDPRQSQQKGSAEVNHEMICRIIPKGIPMERYSKDDISTMMNHINSYGRAALNDCTPYHMFQLMFGYDSLKKPGAELIPPDEIILHPSLLK